MVVNVSYPLNIFVSKSNIAVNFAPSFQKTALPLNHALHRTFGAPVEALYGSEISLPPLPKRRRRIDLEETSHSGVTGVTVPHVLQGEIARLQSHFKVLIETLL